MTGQTFVGLGFVACGAFLIIVTRIMMRHIDRLVDLEKATSLTKWGARQVTPERVGCLLLLATPVGIGIIVVGVWVAVASFW